MRRAACLFLIIIGIAFFSMAVAEKRPDQLYMEGAALFRSGNYEKASQNFMKVLVFFPDSSYAADSVFKIGEGHFRAERFEEAGSYYRLYLERYSLGKNVRDAKMRLSQCESKVGKTIGVARPKIQKPDQPLRAIRVIRFYQKSKSDLDREIALMKSQGANALIVPAFHLQGRPHGFVASKAPLGSYFQTEATPLCKTILPMLAGLVHKYEMNLIVEIPVRSIPGGPRDIEWNPKSESLQASKKLDLFSPEGVKTAVSIIKDLAKVTIDGILLTDLTMSPIEGYGPEAMKAYQHKTGTEIDLKSYFHSVNETSPGNLKYELSPSYGTLAEAKSAQLNKIADKLQQEAHKTDPNLNIWVEVDPKAIDDPAKGLLRLSQNIDSFANPPFSGIFVMVDPPHLTHAGALTARKLSASMDRLLAGATIFTKEPSRVFFCIWIEDGITHKPAPDWQIEAAIVQGKRKNIRDFSAGPLMPGFDFQKIFSDLSDIAETEKKGDK